eukprot:TRINITY_DN51242_c0_g1_i1.p3 TRINITY_DN51242_c0_g1~~TRINITY_DN51242_c0_g1_i1.p3  ORF type:complete len:115 (-),score=2.30 TRINITY_DN51242_c0_g1_i1:39-356(-)
MQLSTNQTQTIRRSKIFFPKKSNRKLPYTKYITNCQTEIQSKQRRDILTIGVLGTTLTSLQLQRVKAEEVSPQVTQKVYLDVSVGKEGPKSIVIALYGNDVPQNR